MNEEYIFSELYGKDYLNKMNNNKGVYIYGFMDEDGDKSFILYYIGKGKIKERITSHIQNLLCGNSTIYKEEYLSEFYKYYKDLKKMNISNDLTGEQIYFPIGTIDSVNWFVNNYDKLRTHVEYMYKKFKFAYVEISDDYDRANLEYHLINKIGKGKLANLSLPKHTIENLNVKITTEDERLLTALKKHENLNID